MKYARLLIRHFLVILIIFPDSMSETFAAAKNPAHEEDAKLIAKEVSLQKYTGTVRGHFVNLRRFNPKMLLSMLDR